MEKYLTHDFWGEIWSDEAISQASAELKKHGLNEDEVSKMIPHVKKLAYYLAEDLQPATKRVIAGLTSMPYLSKKKPMKKLLTIALVLLSVSVWSQTPLMIGATYLSCTDSVTAPPPTGSAISMTKTTGLSVTTYQFTASSPTTTYSFQVKDYTGGNIQSGDSIRVTSATYTICGSSYTLRTDAIPTVTINRGIVYIEYTDCILPLNGTSGTIRIRFSQ